MGLVLYLFFFFLVQRGYRKYVQPFFSIMLQSEERGEGPVFGFLGALQAG